MIELTPQDVSVILRRAGAVPLDDLPVAELNDDGQTEIVRWIESVGKLDDQLSPYAWFALAEEAAATHDPDEPITVEMLPLYTLSGDYETLDLCRESHFDWSIEAVPVEFIQNAEELLDARVPVRFLLLAEAAGEAFAKRVCALCPDLASCEPQILAGAIDAFFVGLCGSAGMVPDEELMFGEDASMRREDFDEVLLRTAIGEGIEAAGKAMLSLDPEIEWPLPEAADLIEAQWL